MAWSNSAKVVVSGSNPPAVSYFNKEVPMKRDMNLIRQILLYAELQSHGGSFKTPAIEGHSEDEVGFHIHLIGDAGLANVSNMPMMGQSSPQARMLSLTNDGYEFLESAKDEATWNKATEVCTEGGKAVTLLGLKTALVEIVKAGVIASLT